MAEIGAGTLDLTSANGYEGGTTINADTLQLAMGATAGAGAITFAAPTATLEIDAPVINGGTFADALTGFATNGTIDLTALAFVSGATATFNGTTLTLLDGTTTEHFMLSSTPAAGTKFHVGGSDGTTIEHCLLSPRHLDRDRPRRRGGRAVGGRRYRGECLGRTATDPLDRPPPYRLHPPSDAGRGLAGIRPRRRLW